MNQKTTVDSQTSEDKKKEQEVDPQVQEALKKLHAANELHAKQNLVEAEKAYREVLELKPDFREASFNLGVTLRDLEQFDEAKSIFENLVAIEPRAALAHNNLGYIASHQRDYATALTHYRKAIDDHFQLAIAHFNLGQLLLQQGEFLEGWKECEWRWQTSQFTPFRCLQPRWDGSPLKGTLLMHTEQGAGDVFQFVRFLPEIRKRVDKLLFVMPESLFCMFKSGDWADEIRAPGEFSADAFTAYLPLLSAPYALKCVTAAEHEVKGAYLTPESRSVELGPPHVKDCKLKVGLTWAGSPTHDNDKHRSLHVRQLVPLLKIPNVAFYSLQKGPQVEQLKELKEDHSSLRDLDSIQKDYADGAAIAKQMDLVITVDTSVLHLAAGLNIPVWGLLSDQCDWRWMRGREDSYWYSSLRLFRQEKLDEWDTVIQRVARELQEVIKGSRSLT